jgi:hypothetical protein
MRTLDIYLTGDRKPVPDLQAIFADTILPASVDALSIRQLEQNLSNYFHKMQGRGENCKVDCYNRNDLDYFFAYPEDYAQARVEWVGKEFKSRGTFLRLRQ